MKKIAVILLVAGLVLAVCQQPCEAGGRYHRGHGHHHGGIGPGAAIGIDLGALALGTVIGAHSQPCLPSGYCYPSQPRGWIEVWETRWRQDWDSWRGCWVSVSYRVRVMAPVY